VGTDRAWSDGTPLSFDEVARLNSVLLVHTGGHAIVALLTVAMAMRLRAAAVGAMLLGAASGALLSAGGPGEVLWIAASLVLIVTLSYTAVLLRTRSSD
jgi:hypothetical protein